MDLSADDWARAHVAQRLVSSDPDLLLEALRELQSIAPEIKYDTLHEIGKALTLASIAHPTLAECRAAIGATDEQPRSHREWLKVPALPDVDERLVAFILEVLGSSTEQASRTAKPLPFEPPAYAGNAAQIETKDTWSLQRDPAENDVGVVVSFGLDSECVVCIGRVWRHDPRWFATLTVQERAGWSTSVVGSDHAMFRPRGIGVAVLF